MDELACARFVSHLVCPRCGAKLDANKGELICCEAGCRYPVIDGVPQLLDGKELKDETIASTEHFYQAMASTYNSRYSVLDDQQRADRLGFVAMIRSMVSTPVILDLGCGHGRDAAFFRKQGCDVIGIDLSQNMLVLAAAKCDACFVRADMRRIPLDSAVVGAVYCHSALYHVPRKDIRRSLAEIARVLKLGGVAYLCLLEGQGDVVMEREEYDDLPIHITLLDSDTITRLLRSVGFTSVDCRSSEWCSKRYLEVTCWK